MSDKNVPDATVTRTFSELLANISLLFVPHRWRQGPINTGFLFSLASAGTLFHISCRTAIDLEASENGRREDYGSTETL